MHVSTDHCVGAEGVIQKFKHLEMAGCEEPETFIFVLLSPLLFHVPNRKARQCGAVNISVNGVIEGEIYVVRLINNETRHTVDVTLVLGENACKLSDLKLCEAGNTNRI